MGNESEHGTNKSREPRFIPHEPKKKTLIPYIYNVSIKDPFLKFFEIW